MELQYFGANCVRITTKKAQLVVDDNLVELALKSATKAGDIALFTGEHKPAPSEVQIVLDMPGEYEVSDIVVAAIAARGHMDEEGKQTATMFRLQVNDIRVLITGHIYPELSDEQLEAIGMVDVMIVPVGGNGYTLDGIGALKVIKKIEPKVIVPTHYADSKIKYEVPQADLSEALKNMSMEIHETVPKLKLKSSELPENLQVITLERQ